MYKSYIEKGKHALYCFSIILLLFLLSVTLFHAVSDNTHMDFFSTFMNTPVTAVCICGGAFLLFIILWKLFSYFRKLSEKLQNRIVILCTVLCVMIQYILLFKIHAVLRYDHLKVFDQALELFRTGQFSLTYGEQYFAQYPFNIPITLFNYFVLCIAKLLSIPESGYMLTIQCVYLAGIDLAVLFSYLILKKLCKKETAFFFLLLCFCNPLLYFYGFGCYTTILMLPLLMGNLWLFTVVLEEKNTKKKLLLAFVFGITFVFGIKIRANLLITLITIIGYLILHVRNTHTFTSGKKQTLYTFAAILAGALICYVASVALESHFVKDDYTDTQLPASYYFLFSANVDSLGSYNEEDHAFIQQFDTLEEKNSASWHALFERLKENGLRGNSFLYDYKLSFTWSDGIDDYAEFIHTSDSYHPLYSYLAGSRRDFFALYCHIYHVMLLVLCIASVVRSCFRKCNTPFYMIELNLLGAILFHLLWEAGWAYSISFSMLLLTLGANGFSTLCPYISDKKPQKVLHLSSAGVFILWIGCFVMHRSYLFDTPFKQMEFVTMQDMSEGEDLMPLLEGNKIIQTFSTDQFFDHIGCKVLNPKGDQNKSSYQINLKDMDGNILGSRTFQGSEVLNKDYCYVRFDPVIPDQMTTYQIEILPVLATATDNLTFLYYNSNNWDIYPKGEMYGLNASDKSDLTFIVYRSVTKEFFE